MNLPAISSGFLNAAAAHGFTPATEKHSYIKVPDVFIGGIDGYEIGIFDGGALSMPANFQWGSILPINGSVQSARKMGN